MTYSEYITRKVASFGLTKDDIEIIMAENQINGDTPVDIIKAQIAMYNAFDEVLKNTLCNISEGGMSTSWNVEAIKMYYNQLCLRLGKPNRLTPAPRIRNRSNIW